VQTGGSLQTRQQLALHSPNALIGSAQVDVDNSVRIARSFNERADQLAVIDKLLQLLAEETSAHAAATSRNLENVKEELTQEEDPSSSRIRRWLEGARQLMQGGSFGHEVVMAAKDLFDRFGLS
jgi:hypothetical protein